MPDNFMHLGFINQLFAGARIIHCVRDPLDTCLSGYMQNFRRGNLQTNDLGHLGAYYRRRVMSIVAGPRDGWIDGARHARIHAPPGHALQASPGNFQQLRSSTA
jgi:hypothetical protein